MFQRVVGSRMIGGQVIEKFVATQKDTKLNLTSAVTVACDAKRPSVVACIYECAYRLSMRLYRRIARRCLAHFSRHAVQQMV